ncbi:MAG TPA: MBL fold metallo-hydrolase [Leptospiraceae bacterium]|nr:MBL fold metallo-hydrolase [Leptospiraceae bacterium]HMX34512.1 MBL fold metallo-hydrolase [Leptospiraceae bacterium]HMY31543.1 MBL fold metallo-hydrolase [Leptospiraceae bacterium]HMZ65908.1 MBL fold metallo-hydrolase [Leptospiraceae bacterium]HNA06697.1 MBL fold metallo-hydrolase [Leptospiraceae bacterium]
MKYLSVLIIFSLVYCSAFGKDPEGTHLEKIKQSPQFDKERDQFVNRRADILEKMRENQNFFKLTLLFFFGGEKHQRPPEKLPELKPDVKEFLEKSDKIKFIWFGHSTFLVNFDGKIILFDPVFSNNASPISLFVKRFQPPVLKLEELPNIDYIIISHDHYDHLDMETIEFFKSKSVKFITPLGVTSHLKEWGITEDRLTELDWWSSINRDDLEIILTPAQHFSGRKGNNQNKTLWGSWIVRNKKQSLYFSGDSGYDTHFKAIGDKYGPFDITFIENGQYNERWRAVHVLPEETAQAFLDLKGKHLVPVHWGMFDLSLHNWYDPIERIEKASKEKNIKLLTPKFGQIVKLEEDTIFETWWKKFIQE